MAANRGIEMRGARSVTGQVYELATTRSEVDCGDCKYFSVDDTPCPTKN